MKEKSSSLSDKVGLPLFAYHPDPLATGSVEPSEARCACCARARGFIYTGPVYAVEDLDREICPWCIADGSAAARFGAAYIDDHTLVRAGLPEEVIREVTQRTPGFRSWQGEAWKCCCGDAGVFHGHPSPEHLLSLNPTALEQFLSLTGWSPEQWKEFIADVYVPGGSPGIYHFTCRNCNKPMYGWDAD